MPNFGLKQPVPVDAKSGDTIYICRCGKTGNRPLCDGSHKGSEHTPLAHSVQVAGAVYVCGCGKSKNQPFCDGSHKA